MSQNNTPLSSNEGAVLSYSERVESLLAGMTVEEKAGQLNLVICGAILEDEGAGKTLISDVRRGRVGTCSYVPTFDDRRMLQHEAVENSRLGIPLLFARDVCHGYKTLFPLPLAQSASWDIDTIEACERCAAAEATADGISWTFAPMLDVSQDPRWGRNVEGAGEDPFLASKIAAARVRGFQGEGDTLSRPETMLACLKHFVGYGDVQAGRDYHTVDVSDRRMLEFHLPAFRAAVDAGAKSVMSAFNEINGIPSTINRDMLTKVLRDEWGFDGLVVTDFNAINELILHGAVRDKAEATAQALDAGIDVDLNAQAYIQQLPRLIKEGKINMSVLDRAVRCVLAVKEALGLFDDPYRYQDVVRRKKLYSTPSNAELAWKISSESVVLLQNENRILPLKKGTDIALIGSLAELKFTFSYWGTGCGDEEYPDTIIERIKKVNRGGRVRYAKGCGLDDDVDTGGFAKAIRTAASSDVVVVVLGETMALSGEANSRSAIGLPGVQTDLLRALHQTGKPIVIVLMNGRAMALQEESEIADAILDVWQQGHQGSRVIADTLFGLNNPQGKLTVTFPRSLGQIPIHYDMKRGGRPKEMYDEVDYRWCSRYCDVENTPLFPFGHGLSYTTFRYANIRLSAKTMTPGKALELSVEVKNSGRRAGTEVVQLYIHDLVASATRPLKQLKDFQRITLKAGQSKRVRFSIDEAILSFYRRDMSWGTEPGEFEVFVGGSSAAEMSARFKLAKNNMGN